ncbi:hypothetical protein F4809DRAFT_469465 [Biscogniauxia mediterranea]|nr:hypothetical protein F4809DRAFT_469465 [Biscogniauxia mediterranea]
MVINIPLPPSPPPPPLLLLLLQPLLRQSPPLPLPPLAVGLLCSVKTIYFREGTTGDNTTRWSVNITCLFPFSVSSFFFNL